MHIYKPSYAGSVEVRIIFIDGTSVQLFVVSQVRDIDNLTFYSFLLCEHFVVMSYVSS